MALITAVTQARLRPGCGERARGSLVRLICSRFVITNEICQNP